MAEDEDTATARYIASNVSTQLMLKVLFELIAMMTDDPNDWRAGIKAKLLELADSMPLSPMPPAQEMKVRGFVRETVGTLLTNQSLN
jgi:hypothetical protein